MKPARKLVLSCTNVMEIKILESTLLNFDENGKGPKIHFSEKAAEMYR
jgi:hypothetical protein